MRWAGAIFFATWLFLDLFFWMEACSTRNRIDDVRHDMMALYRQKEEDRESQKILE